jgi:hypothetical protein
MNDATYNPIVPPPNCGSGSPPGWWPVDPTSPPWLKPGHLPVEVAGTWLVACGPELLRVADGTISPSARRRPVAARRSR